MMGHFFKPWRRKIGVVALVLACAAMAGWVRSLTTLDLLQFQINGQQHQLCSFRGRVRWMSGFPKEGMPLLVTRDAIAVAPTELVPDDDAYFMNTKGWDQFGEWKSTYPTIAIPLTLLSAWLLLSKPRQRTKTSPEPTADEGA